MLEIGSKASNMWHFSCVWNFSPSYWCLLRRFLQLLALYSLTGKCCSGMLARFRLLTWQIASGALSCVFAFLRLVLRSGKLDERDDDGLCARWHVQSLWSFRLGNRLLELLDLADFERFGGWDFCDERYSCLLLQGLKRLRSYIVSDLLVTSKDDMLA